MTNQYANYIDTTPTSTIPEFLTQNDDILLDTTHNNLHDSNMFYNITLPSTSKRKCTIQNIQNHHPRITKIAFNSIDKHK